MSDDRPSITGEIAAAPTITGTSTIPVQDASDCVDLADETAARFRVMQAHEEATFVNRAAYDDNLGELRGLLAALQAYVTAPPIGIHGW
jgi:hypothetical protein